MRRILVVVTAPAPEAGSNEEVFFEFNAKRLKNQSRKRRRLTNVMIHLIKIALLIKALILRKS